ELNTQNSELSRPADRLEPPLRLSIRGIPLDRLAKRLRRARRVSLHQQNATTKHVHPRRRRIELLVEPEQRQGVIRLTRLAESEGSYVQLPLAEIVRSAPVVALPQCPVGPDRRVRTGGGAGLEHDGEAWHGFAHTAMAGRAGHRW